MLSLVKQRKLTASKLLLSCSLRNTYEQDMKFLDGDYDPGPAYAWPLLLLNINGYCIKNARSQNGVFEHTATP